MGAWYALAGGVKEFVQFPFSPEVEKQAHDTLAGLEPFFWMLRAMGLCPAVEIFETKRSSPSVKRRWNIALTIYCGLVGIFLLLGFIATFGFSMVSKLNRNFHRVTWNFTENDVKVLLVK